MGKRLEHFFAGLFLFAVIAGIYSDKIFGSDYIFTEVIQDITNIYGFYPWDNFSVAELKNGYFPLWNSHNGLGVPHLANMQSAVFYPLSWIKFIFGFWNVIDGLLLFRLWLAGFCLYFFARRALGLFWTSAFFAGLSFSLCGYFLRYVYMSHLNVECLLPLQLLLFFELGSKRKFYLWVLSSLGIYLLISGGFPEASLYAILFSSLYFLFGAVPGAAFRVKLGLSLSVLVFGFLLASVQWLGFYEYLGQAWTYHQQGSGLRHLDIAYAISMFSPWFFGSNSQSALAPFLVPGMGTVAVIFCIRGVLGTWPGIRHNAYWFASAIFLAGLIYGLPPFIWLARLFPFNLTYNDKYAAPVLSLCVALLAAQGFEKFIRERALVLDLLSLGLSWVWVSGNLIVALLDGFRPFYALGIKIEMARASTIAVLFLLALSLRRRGAFARMTAALILSAAIGSAYFDHYFNCGIERSDYLFGQLQEARKIKNIFPGPFRYSAEGEILPPNLLLALGVDDLRSYDPLYPRSYVYLLAAVNGLGDQESINRHYQKNKFFQIDRERLNSALAPVLNLTLYSADYDLNFSLVGEVILKQGRETGGYAGWARNEMVEVSGEARKALLMASNDRIDAELESGRSVAAIHFEAALSPVQGQFKGDGAEFQLLTRGQGPRRLAYSRFLNPVLREEDRSWKPVGIPLVFTEPKIRVSLIGLSGPRGNFSHDYLAWGGIRVLHPGFKVEGAESWKQEGVISLNHLKNSFPRYFLAQGIDIIPGKNLEQELASFIRLGSAPEGYFRNQAVVPEPITFQSSGKQLQGQSWVKVIRSRPEQVELELRARTDCFLIASEQYFPGWRARLDDEEQRIHRADLALRAIFVPAGEHKVRFWYEPAWFEVGLFATLAGFFSVLIFSAWGVRKRQSRTQE